MKRFFIALCMTLFLTAPAFGGVTVPENFYSPPSPVYHYNDYNNPNDDTPAVFDIVAHGDNEGWKDWELWIQDSKVLELVGIGKLEEDYVEEGNMDSFNVLPEPINGATSGTWQYTGTGDAFADPNSGFRLYFSIKAGNPNSDGGYNLFAMNDLWYADPNQVVDWTTEMKKLYIKNNLEHLDIGLAGKDISHIAFWTGPKDLPPGETPIPEPATLLLMGIGLLSLAGLGRKTKDSYQAA